MPDGHTFRGHLFAQLTVLGHSQRRGEHLVDEVDFLDGTSLITLSATSEVVEIPAFTTAEGLYDVLRGLVDVRPLSPDSWSRYPDEQSPWSNWLILLYDLALLERNMMEEAVGSRYARIVREGERATVTVTVDSTSHSLAVALTEQPLGIPIDLAHLVRDRRKSAQHGD
jgi:hypothetical protein